jgi:UDP-N-acetylglucosamine--N-acetylmuramyl-(pentapeptide) pyrophosphoryl-undecaprenol N-acetylglucosamine transferase
VSGRLLVIAAGGTGGHMFPAQALAEEMLGRGWRVALSSDDRGLRYAGGFPAEVERRALSSATFARGGVAAKLAVPVLLGAGAWAARKWFAEARPAVVAGFGGYPSVPALAAAAMLGAPQLIHEQNGVLGRVNRWSARRAAAVACGTWPVANAPRGARLVDIGNPVRPAILAAAGAPYAPPTADGPLDLLSFGGSQGASAFSRLIPAAVAALDPSLRARLRLTLQVREAELAEARAALADVTAEVAPFFDDMPARLARAHLVVSRSGASTVAELAAMGRPSILIPFPAAMDDHQTANAQALVAAGAATLAPEGELTPGGLAGHLARLLCDPARLAAMAAAARSRARPDAAAKLGDLIETLADGRNPR